MSMRYYTLKPQTTPLPSTIAGKGVSRCADPGKAADVADSKAAQAGRPKQTAEQPENDPFIRAEAEDDDGYDPYSDRPPAPEPAFQEDPWR